MRFFEGVTEEQIADFEIQNCIQLPQAFKEWLRFSDGGELFSGDLQLFGVAHQPTIDVNDDWAPSSDYIVIGSLSSGDPIIFRKGKEAICIFDHNCGKVHADEIYGDFYAFLQDIPSILGDACEIEEILEHKAITPQFLENKYGFKLDEGTFQNGHNFATVYSSPFAVQFCGAQFMARFDFANSNLEYMTLCPSIKVMEIPKQYREKFLEIYTRNYPSKELQEIKREYCTRKLRAVYGNPNYDTPEISIWRTKEYRIVCYSIFGGHDEYCGGDIRIVFKETSHCKQPKFVKKV